MRTTLVVILVPERGKSQLLIKSGNPALRVQTQFRPAAAPYVFFRRTHKQAAEVFSSLLFYDGKPAKDIFIAFLKNSANGKRSAQIVKEYEVRRPFVELVKFLLKALLYNEYVLSNFPCLGRKGMKNFYSHNPSIA